MNQKVVAFADEFGNNSFDFQNQGSHFIIATVITKPEKIDSLREGINEIRKKHNFQSGEIKSSKVGPNHVRRKKILEDIAKLDISIYAVVFDKRKLSGQGFNYKKSFYKFLNNLLYKELFRTFPNLDLKVDEHGGNDFMREFKKYVDKDHLLSLFSDSDFSITNSKNSEFIQLADFIAGTLGYIYDELKKSEHSHTFQQILSPKISSINYFPKDFSFKEFKESNIDNSFDERIAELCFLRVQNFLDKHIGDSQQRADQINFLKLLLWLQRANPRNRYITSHEIFSHLNQNRYERIQEEYFRTKVVGNLRDNGVLIASGREGYKIPISAKDLDTFINHGKRIILPMVNRIKEARKAIKLATGNELDLLDRVEYLELRKMLDEIERD
ncbi:DUF3800 domain-containing protein [Hymenobacter psychrotolerans]|uniref:DUF3800 domain-containing protein n=1 Tax=Hymenobacter psychrotolerans DSM 18569 TaxID=1121959 RepID=A0A1M7FKQ6_9BACT|nr:DUF3800 domain-containing protein [Hymenobacter psychrotolerans]SHM04682.1 Protein of unknown function [Hymenobacter psychrotolerans DSM 18569]